MPNITTKDSSRAKEICDWLKTIESSEATYFEAAALCSAELQKSEAKVAQLRNELHDSPDPAKWRECALEEAARDALFNFATKNQPCYSQRDRYLQRASQYPSADVVMGELADIALAFSGPALELAHAEDARLTEELGTKDAIVSAVTRSLEQLKAAAEAVQANLIDIDNEPAKAWRAFAGLVALSGAIK